MSEVLHLTPADARRLPWKNGRGVTEELALWPAGSAFERGDFDGRISKAAVDEAGPFSTFPDFDRILVVTSGAGLLLAHGDAAPRARLRPLEPYRFAGEWPTTAELLDGRVADFNVLARRDRVRADIEVLRLGKRRAREALAAGQAFVHALAGAALLRTTGADEAFTLRAGESLWVQDLRGGEELDLAGRADACLLLVVRIGPA